MNTATGVGGLSIPANREVVELEVEGPFCLINGFAVPTREPDGSVPTTINCDGVLDFA